MRSLVLVSMMMILSTAARAESLSRLSVRGQIWANAKANHQTNRLEPSLRLSKSRKGVVTAKIFAVDRSNPEGPLLRLIQSTAKFRLSHTPAGPIVTPIKSGGKLWTEIQYERD